MRMLHYFLAGAILLVPALGWTALSGLMQRGGPQHLWVGLLSATLAVAVHSLVIVFMIVTGRVLREAMRVHRLPKEFLAELNQFFAARATYPLAVGSAFATVAAGVLGFGQRGFGLSPVWHAAAGAGAVLLNVWALFEEGRALARNQDLLDRAAVALDRLESGRAIPPESPAAEPPLDLRRAGLILCVSAWMPYAYWGIVNWRGDFSRVSLHPWIEASLIGAALWAFGPRRRGGP